jgi:hypothetical protein
MARLAEGGRVSSDQIEAIGPRRRFRRGARPIVWTLLIVAVAALLAIPAALVFRTAQDASAQADILRTALEDARASVEGGRLSGLSDRVSAVSTAADHLVATTSSWQWSLLGLVPGMSGSTVAVETLAASFGDIAASATPLAEATSNSSSAFALLAQLPALEPHVRDLQRASRRAAASIMTIDRANLRFGVDSAVEKAAGGVEALDKATTSALDAWPSLRGLLGFDGPRTYLVMLQNPAEARGSGGLFSAFMILTLNRGAPTIREANSRKVLDELRIPVPKNLDPGEIQMWGDFLTKWASFNTSPDFPTTARLAQAGMKVRGTPVNGVIAIDPFTVQAILAGTGPVEHAGVTIDATNAADFFTKGIYEDFPGFEDVDAKDGLALGLLYATVDSVLKRPLDLKALTIHLPGVIDGGHIRAWVPDPNEEAFLDQVGLAHEVAVADPNITVVALNNGTGGKLDAYVTTTVDQEIATCAFDAGEFVGRRRSTVTIALDNAAPRGLPDYVDVRLDDHAAAKGSTKILVTTFGPPGAVDESITANERPADYTSGQAFGRPYWLTQLEVPRGKTRYVTITYADPSTRAQTATVTGAFAPATVSTTTATTTPPCSTSVG